MNNRRHCPQPIASVFLVFIRLQPGEIEQWHAGKDALRPFALGLCREGKVGRSEHVTGQD
jgi:hypothetical protein